MLSFSFMGSSSSLDYSCLVVSPRLGGACLHGKTGHGGVKVRALIFSPASSCLGIWPGTDRRHPVREQINLSVGHDRRVEQPVRERFIRHSFQMKSPDQVQITG